MYKHYSLKIILYISLNKKEFIEDEKNSFVFKTTSPSELYFSVVLAQFNTSLILVGMINYINKKTLQIYGRIFICKIGGINMQNKNIVAFFDIDGTLYRNSLMIEHFKKLVKYEMIDEVKWFSDIKSSFDDWDTRKGDYEKYLDQICDVYEKSLLGIKKSYVDLTSNQVIKLKADRVYKYTRSQIEWHLSQGHLVIFISGSPDYLVEKMAKKYNVTDYAGSIYEFKDDNFTGKVIPMWDNRSKNNKIDEFVEKYNVDLSKSYAYGDTNGDITMLRKVGNPIAINPSKELLNNIITDNSLKQKANIVIERKDMIYKLNADSIESFIY